MSPVIGEPIHGIHVIDTGFHRPQFDAAYLIVENGRGAFVDSGTSHSVGNLLRALERAGLNPPDVDWLILTHVHLDHAGGAGALLQHLPNADVVIHPRGAPHMIDPARLIAGATAVYGEDEMERSYGRIVPIPEARVVIAGDEHVVDLAGRALLCLDTPGHAAHHLCVWDARSQSVFTGDTFGISYRELDSERGAFIVPSTSPVQFDPDAMRASIHRILAEAPEAVHVTHYGRVTGVQHLGASLIAQIDGMVALARDCDGEADRHARLVAGLVRKYTERAQREGIADTAAVAALLEMDIELNAQGLGVWLDRSRRPAQTHT